MRNGVKEHVQEYWAQFIEHVGRRDKVYVAISGMAVAAFTLALFVATFLLWFAGERHSERQLRAYVFIEGGAIKLVNNEAAVMADFSLKNFGQTPGYDFESWTNIKIGDRAAPPKEERKPASQRSIIGPSATLLAPSQIIPITAAERSEINAGTKAIFVWGEATYRDAFGSRWIFTFRDTNGAIEIATTDNVTGRVLWRGWGLRPYAGGYEEKKQ